MWCQGRREGLNGCMPSFLLRLSRAESKHLIKVTFNLHLIGFSIPIGRNRTRKRETSSKNRSIRPAGVWGVLRKIYQFSSTHAHEIPSLITDCPRKPQSAINFFASNLFGRTKKGHEMFDRLEIFNFTFGLYPSQPPPPSPSPILEPQIDVQTTQNENH